MTKPNVALFIKTYSQYGGVEQFCYRLCEYLKAKGYPVSIYCGEDKSGEKKTNVHVMGMSRPGRFLKTASLYYKTHRQLQKINRESSKTVSICFGNMGGCDIYRSGGPHIDFMRRSLKAQRGYLKKCNKILSRFFSPINWLMPALDQMVYNHKDTHLHIAISQKVKNAIVQQFPHVKSKTVVIPNGIDKNKFNHREFKKLREAARTWYGIEPHHKAIGFCSTNFELKGLDRLILALTALPEEYILVAAGGRNHQKYLDYASNLGLRNRILFPGKEDNMPRFYAALDIFCHPSFFDTFGSVVAEALAMGLPTVTTKDTGACDLIKNGDNGYVVPTPDPQSLSEAIWKLRNHSAGQKFACSLSDEEVFSQYESLIKTIAEKKN